MLVAVVLRCCSAVFVAVLNKQLNELLFKDRGAGLGRR